MWDKGWDQIFKNNEWSKYPSEELIRFIARNYYHLQNRQEINILEIGCGTGANIWYLASEGFTVSGIDGSSIALERAKKRLLMENLEAELVIGDVIDLPFEKNTFDCVIDNECLYANSYEDSIRIIAEVKRVIKPGGLFYSKTFMTGTYGDSNGEKLGNEKNTYNKIYKGALRDGYGIIRFTDREEIYQLYGSFCIEVIDYVIRSDKNSSYEVKEWIIICRKR